MTIKLVSDSTCDLPQSMLAEHHINIVPVNIQFGAETYYENVSIFPDTFYRKVIDEGIFPQTSQPSVGQFTEMYLSLAGQPDPIISVHISSRLSGTYQSAILAARQVADKVTVHVIDSKASSGGLGWMMVEAAELIRQGKSAAEITAMLEAKREKISIFLMLDNLKFARMSGRINRLAALLGSALNLKPVIGLHNGALKAGDRVRSAKAGMRRIIELTQAQVQGSPVKICVLHALAPENAQRLFDIAGQSLNVKDSFITDVAISIAVHFGPGTFGLVTYSAE